MILQVESDILNKTLLSCRRILMYVALFSFFSNTLVLTVPLYMLQIFDRVLASHSHETLFYLTLLALLALATLGVLEVIRSQALVTLGHWLDQKLSPEVLRCGMDAALAHHSNPMQSLHDVQNIRAFLSNPLSYTLFDAPWAPLFIFIIFLLHPLLGWFTLAGACILLGLAYINQTLTQHLGEKNFFAHQQAQAQLQTAFHNAETIQAMGMLEDVIQHWEHKNDHTLELSTVANHRTNLIVSISKATRLVLQIGILALGAYLVIDNRLTPGAMITASILLTRAYAPVEQSIAAWKLFQSAKAAYIRLNQVFKAPSLRTNSIVLQEVKGMLQVENVSFVPKGSEKTLLKHIGFEIKAGEFLVIIGSSAAGKTTLSRLLAGVFQPTEGVVRLDGADIYAWERSDIGRFIGYMPQEIELFIGTVQDNIGRMTQANEKEIVAASQIAGAHEFILRLSEGYKTKLYDAGHSLSGGQRQQLALARAVFREPRLLILDEPTSYLDQQGQISLFNAILTLRKKGSTVVVVSHHPEMIKRADKLLWLERGEIKIFGAREQVLQELTHKQTKPPAQVPSPAREP